MVSYQKLYNNFKIFLEPITQSQKKKKKKDKSSRNPKKIVKGDRKVINEFSNEIAVIR